MSPNVLKYLPMHSQKLSGLLGSIASSLGAPEAIGELAHSATGLGSNVSSINGAGGEKAIEKLINTSNAVSASLDTANELITKVKPLGRVATALAPKLVNGLGVFAEHVSPLAWASGTAYQAGKVMADPEKSRAEVFSQTDADQPFYKRMWAGVNNPTAVLDAAAEGLRQSGSNDKRDPIKKLPASTQLELTPDPNTKAKDTLVNMTTSLKSAEDKGLLGRAIDGATNWFNDKTVPTLIDSPEEKVRAAQRNTALGYSSLFGAGMGALTGAALGKKDEDGKVHRLRNMLIGAGLGGIGSRVFVDQFVAPGLAQRLGADRSFLQKWVLPKQDDFNVSRGEAVQREMDRRALSKPNEDALNMADALIR